MTFKFKLRIVEGTVAVRVMMSALALCAVSEVARAQQTHAKDMIAAFQSICAAGETGQKTELGRADGLGWRTSGSQAPKNFDPATQRLSPSDGPALILTTMSDITGSETHESCAVSSLTGVQGLADAVRDLLGSAATFSMTGSATFPVVKDGTRWQSASTMNQAAFVAAKQGGRFYSITVVNNGATPPDGSDGYAATVAFLRATPKS